MTLNFILQPIGYILGEFDVSFYLNYKFYKKNLYD